MCNATKGNNEGKNEEKSSSSSSVMTMIQSKREVFVFAAVLVVALLFGMMNYMSNNSMTRKNVDETTTTTTVRADTTTGMTFDLTRSFTIAKRSAFSLYGVGTRKKAILNIYSLGLYVSPNLKRQLAAASSSSSDDGSANPCQIIMDSTAPKAVQLTFVMGIGPERIAEAVSQLTNVNESVRDDFYRMIVDGMGKGNKLRKGESMTFEWKNQDTILVTGRDGISLGTMKDKALARGVLNLYVGSKSVSPSLKKDMKCTM